MAPVKSLLAFLCMASACAFATTPIEFAPLEQLPASGTLVVPVTDKSQFPAPLAEPLRAELGIAATAAGFKGKKDSTLTLYGLGGYARVLLVGIGDQPMTASALEDFGGSAAQKLDGKGPQPVNILWPGYTGEAAQAPAHIALGLRLGAYRFDKYKAADDSAETPAEPRLVIYSKQSSAAANHWRDQLEPVSRGVYFARDLISEPANVIYPASFVERTRRAFKDIDNVKITALDTRDMSKLGMGALLGVGMGSERDPRLLVVSYSGGFSGQKPVVFVGKGVTFDSGGLSLKPPKGMWRMKYDMSGAAAATGTLLALASRKAPINAIAVAALVENMPSQRAQRPGDVRTAITGKTIEIINTDAEGRLILADALAYAEREFKPAVMVDLATLTGSIRVALGSAYGGLFTRHDELAQQLTSAGQKAGEEVWRMPLHEEFRKAIKSDIADIKNSDEGAYGGASIGAEVLGNFVAEDTRWAHLDIAGKAWGFEATPTAPKGAVGWGIRLLNQMVSDYYEPR